MLAGGHFSARTAAALPAPPNRSFGKLKMTSVCDKEATPRGYGSREPELQQTDGTDSTSSEEPDRLG